MNSDNVQEIEIPEAVSNSIGTYRISSNGTSFNYSTPAFLHPETVRRVIIEQYRMNWLVEEIPSTTEGVNDLNK
jgi:hypothetical protein